MTVEAEIKNAIDASVIALDVVKPDWLDFMPEDVRKLDVMNEYKCPLHYAFGDFWHGWEALRNGGYEPAQLAFATLSGWEDLTDNELYSARIELRLAWRERVTELRNNS